MFLAVGPYPMKSILFIFISVLAAIVTFVVIQKKSEDGCIP
jgi:preprotein translocase subunit SecG